MDDKGDSARSNTILMDYSDLSSLQTMHLNHVLAIFQKTLCCHHCE